MQPTGEYTTIQRNKSNVGSRYIAFGIADHKCREIGAHIAIWEIDVVTSDAPEADAPEAMVSDDVPAGHYFAFELHATRDKRSYGVLQHFQLFTSADARETAIATYLSAAKKRAHKR
jgi:hypothetical protein